MELKRRIGKALDGDTTDDEQGFEIGTIKVLFEDGKILVLREGNVIAKCSINEFSRHPNTSFRRIGKAMQMPDDE